MKKKHCCLVVALAKSCARHAGKIKNDDDWNCNFNHLCAGIAADYFDAILKALPKATDECGARRMVNPKDGLTMSFDTLKEAKAYCRFRDFVVDLMD